MQELLILEICYFSFYFYGITWYCGAMVKLMQVPMLGEGLFPLEQVELVIHNQPTLIR